MEHGYYWLHLEDEGHEVVEINGDAMYRCGSDVTCCLDDGRWLEFGEALDVVAIIGPLVPQRMNGMENAPGSWQPIATAPHDGSLVLAWRDTWDHPGFVRWILNHRTGTEFWNDDCEFDAYDQEHEPPTHWCPLPPLPRAVQQRG